MIKAKGRLRKGLDEEVHTKVVASLSGYRWGWKKVYSWMMNSSRLGHWIMFPTPWLPFKSRLLTNFSGPHTTLPPAPKWNKRKTFQFRYIDWSVNLSRHTWFDCLMLHNGWSSSRVLGRREKNQSNMRRVLTSSVITKGDVSLISTTWMLPSPKALAWSFVVCELTCKLVALFPSIDCENGLLVGRVVGVKFNWKIEKG